MNGDLISRDAFNNALENRYLNYEFEKRGLPRLDEVSLDCHRALEAQGNVIRDVLYEQPAVEINGDTSDGYHTSPEWDGHTPEEAINRIGKLEPLSNARRTHAERKLGPKKRKLVARFLELT